MSRVFWDAMLFVYLLEDHPEYAETVRSLLAASRRRSDTLLTSHLSLAEALVGTPQGSGQALILRNAILGMGFTFVSFDQDAVEPFRMLRTDYRLKQPDAMHLACAAAANTDMFLTNDTELLKKKLRIPGVQFIANFKNAPL